MRKFLLLVIVAAIGGGGYTFLQKFRIEGLENLHVVPRDGSSSGNYGQVSLPKVARTAGAIRVASFNIQVFGEKKLANPRVADCWPRSCGNSTSWRSRRFARSRTSCRSSST